MEATTAQASELERRVDLSIAIADIEKEMDQRLKRMGKRAHPLAIFAGIGNENVGHGQLSQGAALE